ncbi:MAG: hypothetical protein U0271_34685 [Polyangiaceae bacterium]
MSARPLRLLAIAFAALTMLAAPAARAEDLSSTVARARDQAGQGNYPEALKILSSLKGKTLPPALAIDAALIETTSLIVTSTSDAAAQACGRAIVAAGYDPDVARELSPKVRDVCKLAAKKVRGDRLAAEKSDMGKLSVTPPEVAYAPVRVSTTVEKRPAWLRVVARVTVSTLEGSFDVPLIPSDEGPLLGTLDPSWIRPGSKLSIKLVAQDRFGDLGDPRDSVDVDVPAAEAAIALGEIPRGAEVKLDGAVVTPDARGTISATAGKHEVRLVLADGAAAETDVELTRGLVTRVALTPAQEAPSRAGAWVATAAAIALGIGGGILFVNAELNRQELEDAAAEREPGTDLPAHSYAELRDIDDQRLLFQNIGIGLAAGAGAATVVAIVLWVIPGSGPKKPEAAALRVIPVVGPSVGGVVLQGEWGSL